MVKNDRVKIANGKNLIISIDSEKLPKGLKTIITDSYIFESNKEKTIYDVMIVSQEEAGVYSLKFTLLSAENKKIQEVAGELEVTKKIEIAQICYSWFGAQWFVNIILWLILIILIIILLLLIKWRRS